MDGKLKIWIISTVVGMLVLGACATQQFTGSKGDLRPLPIIEGTTIVVPRAWDPQEPPRDWKWIVIHHSASDTGGALAFDQWHRRRGWDELGYHFVIDNGEGMPDGNVEVGSRWLKQKYGAHAKSADGQYNERGIGICMVGNFEKGRPTPAQWEALVKLVAFVSTRYHVDSDKIIGHHDVNPKTLCPGKNLSLEQLRSDVKQYISSHRNHSQSLSTGQALMG